MQRASLLRMKLFETWRKAAGALFLSFACVALTPATGCMCTQVGCDDGVQVVLALSGDVSDLEGGAIRACLNNECTEGSTRFDVDSGLVLCDIDSDAVSNCVGEVDAQGAIEFRLRLVVDADTAEDGDRASVQVTAADGATVLGEREGEVEYETVHPNGALCGPSCVDGTL